MLRDKCTVARSLGNPVNSKESAAELLEVDLVHFLATPFMQHVAVTGRHP